MADYFSPDGKPASKHLTFLTDFISPVRRGSRKHYTSLPLRTMLEHQIDVLQIINGAFSMLTRSCRYLSKLLTAMVAHIYNRPQPAYNNNDNEDTIGKNL